MKKFKVGDRVILDYGNRYSDNSSNGQKGVIDARDLGARYGVTWDYGGVSGEEECYLRFETEPTFADVALRYARALKAKDKAFREAAEAKTKAEATLDEWYAARAALVAAQE